MIVDNLNKITKRKDYRPLSWLCIKVFINFEISKNFVIVKSKLYFKKNVINSFTNSYIYLYGKNLETLNSSINFNNKFKPVSFNKYLSDLNVIKIKVPISTKRVIFKSVVKIYPKKNYSLEGVYESNKMICSQCEPEGFRKITWFPDRPDNLSIFTTRIESSLKYKYLLSNGNLIKSGVTNSKKNKYVLWKDPFPKPSYLFALVAGDLDLSEDKYFTKSGKKILLQIYTDKGNSHLTEFAMKSLKKAMSWDEKKYGLEYDLNRFMIVAVNHFNMGAMENKGLNIFNSKFVLSNINTATDQDMINIESIIAHEYFHNWTGNRVTCRDWFQLTLKEGLTVFREQQFSGDMRDLSLKRIEDVSLLKSVQFPEDMGSNKHSIRPNQYLEVNNFYTPTIYEKGAEVIRMLSNYLGENKFINSVKYYLKNFDGKAATCEDFINSLEITSKLYLKDFFKWYDQFGVINLNISRKCKSKNEIEIKFSQDCKFYKKAIPIPIKFALFNKNGKFIKFKLNGSKIQKEHTFILNKKIDKVIVKNVDCFATPSFLRNFSAPVNMKNDLTNEELLRILKFDDDNFNKWDAAQNLYLNYFKKKSTSGFIDVMEDILKINKLNKSILALILKPPSTEMFEHSKDISDPLETYFDRKKYLIEFFKKIEKTLFKVVLDIKKTNYEHKKSIDTRLFLSIALPYLCSIKNHDAYDIALSFCKSNIMTIKTIGLNCFIRNGHPESIKLLSDFYDEFSFDKLVVEKWFAMMASFNLKNNNSLDFIKNLLRHKQFDYKNPNKVRSVLGTFQKDNIELFHADNESGYDFISKQIIKIDKINPQISARLILPLTRYSNYNLTRKNKMLKYVKRIMDFNPSKDLYEIASKALN